MLPWKLRKRQILPVNQNLSLVYFPPAKFQLVSCNLSLAMIWQMTYTQKLPKLCSATLTVSHSHINSKKCLTHEGASNQPTYATDISIIKEIKGDVNTIKNTLKKNPTTYTCSYTVHL